MKIASLVLIEYRTYWDSNKIPGFRESTGSILMQLEHRNSEHKILTSLKKKKEKKDTTTTMKIEPKKFREKKSANS